MKPYKGEEGRDGLDQREERIIISEEVDRFGKLHKVCGVMPRCGSRRGRQRFVAQ